MEFPRRTVWGYAIMLLCVGSWVLSSASVQLLNRKVPDFQLAVLRYLGIFILASIPLMATKSNPEVPKESCVYVLMMGSCTVGFNVLYYYAVAVLPLSHISFMSVCKIIIVTVASRLLLKEAHNIILSVSILGCIFGMIFLIQPWSGFTEGFIKPLTNFTLESAATNYAVNNSSINDSKPTHPESSKGISQIALGYIALVLAAFFEVFYILLGGVYLQKEKPIVLIFLTSALAIPFSLFCCLYREDPVLIHELYTMALVAVHAVGSGVGMLCLLTACHYITPVQVTIINTMENVLELVLQYTLFSTTLYGRRNALEVVGCLLITLSVTLSGLFNNVEKHEDF